jgi:hypothetical protein
MAITLHSIVLLVFFTIALASNKFGVGLVTEGTSDQINLVKSLAGDRGWVSGAQRLILIIVLNIIVRFFFSLLVWTTTHSTRLRAGKIPFKVVKFSDFNNYSENYLQRLRQQIFPSRFAFRLPGDNNSGGRIA